MDNLDQGVPTSGKRVNTTSDAIDQESDGNHWKRKLQSTNNCITGNSSAVDDLRWFSGTSLFDSPDKTNFFNRWFCCKDACMLTHEPLESLHQFQGPRNLHVINVWGRRNLVGAICMSTTAISSQKKSLRGNAAIHSRFCYWKETESESPVRIYYSTRRVFLTKIFRFSPKFPLSWKFMSSFSTTR